MPLRIAAGLAKLSHLMPEEEPFSFQFWANLITSKNVGGKPYCSSLVCNLASEFYNQKFIKMSLELSHAMSDFCDSLNS